MEQRAPVPIMAAYIPTYVHTYIHAPFLLYPVRIVCATDNQLTALRFSSCLEKVYHFVVLEVSSWNVLVKNSRRGPEYVQFACSIDVRGQHCVSCD